MNLKNVQRNKTDFFLIEDALNSEEMKDLFLTFFYLKSHFLSPEGTLSARDENGNILKSNEGIFLENQVPQPKIASKIGDKLHSAITSIAAVDEKKDSVYYAARFIRKASHLISYYSRDSDHYQWHRDHSVITCLIWFHEGEKNYTGGEFYLPELDYTIDCNHNTGVIIPGSLLHEVKPIKIIDKNRESGRICYSVFMNM